MSNAVMAAKRPILFLANGNGEDSIAAAIVRALPTGCDAQAYPVVGAGDAFKGVCPIVGPRAHVPSEGWRHTQGSVARDVQGGMLKSIPPAVAFLKANKAHYEKIVAVGDAVTPLLCWLAGVKIDVYLDVFKSGYAHRYTALERMLLRKVTKKIFCRDDMLAAALCAKGLNAASAGNIMLDTVPRGEYDISARRRRPTMVTLLPGSRVWTGESLKLYADALRQLPQNLLPDLFVAVAGGLSPEELAHGSSLTFKSPKSGEVADLGQLTGDNLDLYLVRGAVGNLIEASDVVLSQAGTATQQALGLGKPVITFNRTDNRQKRMRDEQALMGEARLLTSPDAGSVAAALTGLLENPEERARLGAIGQVRMGGPGTLAAVVAALTEHNRA